MYQKISKKLNVEREEPYMSRKQANNQEGMSPHYQAFLVFSRSITPLSLKTKIEKLAELICEVDDPKTLSILEYLIDQLNVQQEFNVGIFNEEFIDALLKLASCQKQHIFSHENFKKILFEAIVHFNHISVEKVNLICDMHSNGMPEDLLVDRLLN